MTDEDATPEEKIAAVQLVLASRGMRDDPPRQFAMIEWILGGEDGGRSPASVQLFMDAIESTKAPAA
jgi:hypothetical protein